MGKNPFIVFLKALPLRWSLRKLTRSGSDDGAGNELPAPKPKWFSVGGGQTGGGTLSLASNLVIQTMNNGRLRAFTADKGDKVLDIALPLTSGVGAPMTYQLDGKQYIAVMAGTGAGAGRGLGAPPAAPLEPTAAAAQRGNNAPAANNNPKLFVYTLDPPSAAAR